jgi:hypothetical protein
VADLPEAVQKHVRAGAISAHVAMKYLVPLARANRAEGEQRAVAVAPLGLTTRQMAAVYAAWVAASMQTRELILKDPMLVVRAREEARRARESPATAAQQILSDLGALGGLAGRTYQRTRQGGLRGLLAPEREEVEHVFSQTRRDMMRLIKRLEKELSDARSEHSRSDPATA